MLHDPAEHIKEVVIGLFFSWNLLLQAGIGEPSHGLDKFVVSLAQALDRLPPGGGAGVFDGREVLFVAQVDGLTRSTAAHRAVPGRDVQDQFPNTVRVLDRPRCCLLGVDVLKNFENGVSVPRVTFKSAAGSTFPRG